MTSHLATTAPPPTEPPPPAPRPVAVDPLFLAAPQVSTFVGTQPLTNASGFFFERDDRLFLVTSRHVVIDEDTQHFPDRLEIELHLDATNLTRSTGFSMLLYNEGEAVWRQGKDSGGEIDVAVIELDAAFSTAQNTLVKFTPLAQMSSEERWAYIRMLELPYNSLHERGFVSIGCEPCTRPVLPNQHEREGRWWWEEATQKECGLHAGNLIAKV